MITTATGLSIAIPVNVMYNFFVSRIDRLVADMEEGAQAVLDLVWSLDTRFDAEAHGSSDRTQA
jgi:biopolymer transport protein ExbB